MAGLSPVSLIPARRYLERHPQLFRAASIIVFALARCRTKSQRVTASIPSLLTVRFAAGNHLRKNPWVSISFMKVVSTKSSGFFGPAGAVLFQRPNGSVVELVRFNLESFEVDDEGLAALFSL